MNKIEEAIKEADDLTQEAGVIVKGGKKYLQVKDRVSIFRKRFGLDYGINTEIIDNDERHIIIKATITLLEVAMQKNLKVRALILHQQ